MSDDFTLNAVIRDDLGKGASRRLRREAGMVPVILYGGDQPPVTLSLTQKELNKSLDNEAFYSHVIKLIVNGKEESAIIKDLQRHPFKPTVLHADFLRVQKDKPINVHVPLHFLNEETSPGVKAGGIVSHQQSEVEIICLPGDLPEFIEVDMQDVELDQIIHLSDLKLAKNLKLAALLQGDDHDLPVATIQEPRGGAEEEVEAEAAEQPEEGEEPEA